MSNTAEHYRCRHLFTDGRRCGSPALRQEKFCYYHHTSRLPAPAPRRPSPESAWNFDLPLPGDHGAIQLALGEVIRRIAADTIDTKRAGMLLYALRLASLNLRHAAADQPQPLPDSEPITDVVMDPEEGPIASTGDPLEPGQLLISPRLFLEEQQKTREYRLEPPAEAAPSRPAPRTPRTEPTPPPPESEPIHISLYQKYMDVGVPEAAAIEIAACERYSQFPDKYPKPASIPLEYDLMMRAERAGAQAILQERRARSGH